MRRSRWRSTSARHFRPRRSRRARAWSCPCAGPRAAATLSGNAPATACSASTRAAFFPTFAPDSAEALQKIGFDGYAIGGLAVGEGQEKMFEVLEGRGAAAAGGQTTLPDGRRHAGRHSRRGRARRGHVRLRDPDARRAHGRGYTRAGVFNLRNARFADDDRPLDEACGCPLCARHSRAYLHHLFRARRCSARCC